MIDKEAKPMTKTKQAKPTDPRVAYLHSIGLTDTTAADLVAPEIGALQHRADRPFEWVGKVHDEFEYYRAVDDNSITAAEGRGYFRLPAECGVRMRGCHTDKEIIMARTKEVAEVHRLADLQRIEAERSGSFQQATPLSNGIAINEQVTRQPIAAPVEG